MQRIEDFMNWLSDMDWGWWPVLSLRPPKNQDIDNSVLLKISLVFGIVPGQLAFVIDVVLKMVKPTFLLLGLLIVGGWIAFILVYKTTIACFWNRRARRICAEQAGDALSKLDLPGRNGPSESPLRTLLVATCLVGSIVAIFTYVLLSSHHEQHVAASLKSKGLECEFKDNAVREVIARPGCSVNDEDISVLSCFSHLRLLSLANTTVSGRTLSQLTSPYLEVLVLCSTNTTDDSLAGLKQFKKLAYLDLDNCPITGAGFCYLKALPSLRSLSCESAPINDDSLSNIGQCLSLDRLVLNGTKVDGRGLLLLRSLQLRELYLNGLPIIDDDLSALIDMPLEALLLNKTKITDDGFMFICQSIPTLTWIEVSGTAVTQTAVDAARSRFPNLRIFDDAIEDMENQKRQEPISSGATQ